MKMKYMSLFFLLTVIIVLSAGAVSAEDISTTDMGVVSGEVDVATVNPWSTSGELSYNIPDNADIQSANLYVNVYSGSAKNTHGANTNVSVNGNQIANEQLWYAEDTTKDPIAHNINNHTTKSYSDYQMYYNITENVKGLAGTTLKINVDTFAMEDKSFDGRIKLIGLVLAYNDGDDDKIYYWVNSGQSWTDGNCSTIFDTSSLTKINSAKLTNVALSSSEATYKLNNNLLLDPTHTSGNYYQYNEWDVTDKLVKGQQSTVDYIGTAGTYGVSFKNVLAVLKVDSTNLLADTVFSTEYKNTCYAGTNNTLAINVTVNKDGKYTVKLLADGVVVDSSVIDAIAGVKNSLYLTDSNIRPVDETTVNGADNNKVNYTVVIEYNGAVVNESSLVVPVLYNGNLGKDLAYPSETMEPFYNGFITGDVVVDIKDVSSYLAAANLTRSDIWTINLDENSNLVSAFVYIAYNWDKSGSAGPVFNVSFNNVNIVPVASYRDQSNLGSYGKYGYGLFVYDVSDLINNGENTLVLSKEAGLTAVYPSSLIYLYNNTNSDVLKHIYIANGADLLAGSSNNLANRTVKADSTIDLGSVTDSVLYVFAASAQSGEGNIIFNNQEYLNVWNGSSSSTDVWTSSVDTVSGTNNLSFVATGSTILALQQMVVSTFVKVNLTLNPVNLSTSYDSGKYFQVKVLDNNKNPVSGVKLILKIYNGSKLYKTVSVTTDKNGVAKFSASKLAIGTHKVVVSLADTDKYEAISEKAYVKVAKAATTVTAKKVTFKKGAKKYFTVTIKNKATKKVVKSLTLKIKVYTGKKYKTYKVKTNTKGVAKLSTKALKKGTHKVAISTTSKNYTVSKSGKLIVIK
ncbi:MAG: DUF3344 domain-containing protein [archaeon]|nr:DUF3344 domain-containing protein [archaeon]